MNLKISLFCIGLILLMITGCRNAASDYIDPRGPEFAGDESCIQCHKTIHESHSVTSHALAMSKATRENVLGAFDAPDAVFDYGNGKKLHMEKHNSQRYQVLYEESRKIQAFPIEMVFGTKHAQTFAYWKNGNTYELPASYYASADCWGTSPGFSASQPNFDRKIIKDCYACHGSNASSSVNDGSNSYMSDLENIVRPETIVYGIDCERCHGPAKEHVNHHLKNPGEKTAVAIRAFSSLTPKQKLDACAICHSGADGMKMKSRFQFRPGDRIEDFYRPTSDSRTDIDVHGNQYGLLIQSKCFIKSGKMDCTTCHKPHENVSASAESNSVSCIGCHAKPMHSGKTTSEITSKKLTRNCIECHMPKQDSRAIKFQRSANAPFEKYQLRTHKIGVYSAAKVQ